MHQGLPPFSCGVKPTNLLIGNQVLHNKMEERKLIIRALYQKYIVWDLQPGSWPWGYEKFSCSTQLSTKFRLLIKTKILTNKEVPFFKFLICCIYHAKMPTFMSRISDKFRVQLS